jgi:uncharacterized membrane protein (DUF485 family)
MRDNRVSAEESHQADMLIPYGHFFEVEYFFFLLQITYEKQYLNAPLLILILR